jgi:pilus assembly protein Flp/PilA
MSKMMRKIWRQGNEAALRAQVQLREGLRALPTVRARLGKGQGGATMVEYAILVALIAVAAIAIIYTLGGQINDAFQAVSDKITEYTT